ncbi:hypothetical protein HYP55_gp191 [Salmonella phage Mutine]|uniref:Uncharacterized protein n=3 Tax=Kuttervirus TaxID=2169536 RepID=A0A2H5BPE2_9CAUD|nr:hypothetical protein HYP55_gp191 [Salmonella phage Mutine]YP_009889153.1 hypothetical protein HYQ38_gp018 [Salmonella phage maane]AUG88194.1 hypothetical protein CPT_Mutine_062 [Salmonella phage Mutine]QIO03425.1 hypothetical protein maane_18 [Salmonella phage maane]
MTKTEINAILKEIGLCNLKRRSDPYSYQPAKPVRDCQGKMIKGIYCAEVGPMTVTSPHVDRFNAIVEEFCDKVLGGLAKDLCSPDTKVVTFGSHLVAFHLTSFRVHGDYHGYYAQVSIRK